MSEKKAVKKAVAKKAPAKVQPKVDKVSFEEIEQRLLSVETKVGAIGRILSKIKGFLEKMFHFDIDGDGNIGKMAIFLVCAFSLVLSAHGASGNPIKGDKAGWQVAAIRADGTFDTQGGITADGDATISGDIVCSGSVSAIGSTSQTITNGQAITLSDGWNIITPSGMANAQTNIVTIANAVAGYDYKVVVASAASNLLGFADSGNLRLSAAFNGDANDVLLLWGYSTNFVETSRSAN